ncbi:hypothetical protein Barb7_02785 [Bacteroidales bacterium Barb7]|nr:hypothetical protein Barb7_02785 [Bacteroidales bacterium Barb7]
MQAIDQIVVGNKLMQKALGMAIGAEAEHDFRIGGIGLCDGGDPLVAYRAAVGFREQ